MQYKILATDIDNTLIPFGEECARPAVVKAIKKIQEAGVKLVVSTGRSFNAMNTPEIFGGLRWDYAVTCSGAQVRDAEGKVLFEETLTSEEMYALVDFCEDDDYCLHFAFDDGYYAYVNYPELKKLYDNMPNTGMTMKDGEDQNRHLDSMPTAAFAVLPTNGGVERFNAKYAHLELSFMQIGRSENGEWIVYDIVRGHVDKATGIAHLCEKLNVDMQQVVAAGDSGNDKGMIQAAGLGCAMANATDDVKAIADIVIGDVRKDGLADMIETLWFGDASLLSK